MDVARQARVRGPLTKGMRLIEIGASHAPIAPKADGWNTTVVDHAPRAELRDKYGSLGVDVSAVEEVDVIWTEGSLLDAVPKALHGTFDGLIASHVIEHIPDTIGFLKAADALLNPSGTVALAVPDRRFCFNFFQAPTFTGDLIAAQGRVRHTKRTAFNEAAYNVARSGVTGWGPQTDAFQFLGSLPAALAAFNEASEDPASPYRDSHCWYFTPAGFELMLLELNHLGLTSWWPQAIERAPGVEFYTWLVRRKIDFGKEADFDEKRMRLLYEMVREAREQIDQLPP